MSDNDPISDFIQVLFLPVHLFQLGLVILAMFAVCVGVTFGGQTYSCHDCNCSQGVVIEVEAEQ